jgi:hypothetical protein
MYSLLESRYLHILQVMEMVRLTMTEIKTEIEMGIEMGTKK